MDVLALCVRALLGDCAEVAGLSGSPFPSLLAQVRVVARPAAASGPLRPVWSGPACCVWRRARIRPPCPFPPQRDDPSAPEACLQYAVRLLLHPK